MRKVFDYVRGLHSLGSGSPFYRHSHEEKVPWPRIDHPLHNADETTIMKWGLVQGNLEEVRREVDRLNRLSLTEKGGDTNVMGRSVISNNLSKPNRVTYTSLLPYYDAALAVKTSEGYRWRVTDPDYASEVNPGDITPGHCILHEFRLVVPKESKLKWITLRIGTTVMKLVQRFDNYPEKGIMEFLQRYLGIPLSVEVDEFKYLTVPFFFSREPAYGIPILAMGTVEITFDLESCHGDPRVLAGLEVLHSREEVREIRRSRAHRVEETFIDNPRDIAERWIFMNCFWRPMSGVSGTRRVRLVHDGGVDEEIRGVFWKVSNSHVRVRLDYWFDDDPQSWIPLVDLHPSAILSEIELKTRILPTTSGTYLTPSESRRGMGGLLLSKYVDSLDCEPGLSPRNGDLVLEFDNPGPELEVYLLTSRDCQIA